MPDESLRGDSARNLEKSANSPVPEVAGIARAVGKESERTGILKAKELMKSNIAARKVAKDRAERKLFNDTLERARRKDK